MSKHVIHLGWAGAAGGYRFVGMSEKVEIKQDDKFVTLKSKELEQWLGKPIEWDGDGKPTNMTPEDAERLGMMIGVRDAIQSNPKISPEAKERIFSKLPRAPFSGQDPNALAEKLLYDDSVNETTRLLHDLNPRERRNVLKQLRRENRQQQRRDAEELQRIRAEKVALTQMEESITEIKSWLLNPLVLQSPPATMFHHLRQAIMDGEAIHWQRFMRRMQNGSALRELDLASFEEAWGDASVFLVEHDWAKAFANAKDYLGGEIKLPDEACSFEFRISGRHIIAVTADVEGQVYMQPIMRSAAGWLVPEYVYFLSANGKWDVVQSRGGGDVDMLAGLVDLIGEQIKAVAVALDAEVAASEVIRAPHKMNHARERRGKLPVSSYHVVSLARRNRAARLEREPGTEPAYHVRLHFRRGHWRHYPTHKTWIKWMLVGDPDLGFVDKHYKL